MVDLRAKSSVLSIVVVIVLVFLLSWFALGYDLLPGFEGEHAGIYGYQPRGEPVSVIDTPMSAPPGPCSYSWLGGDTMQSGAVVVKTAPVVCALTLVPNIDYLSFTMGNVIPYSNPYTQPISVSYYVPLAGGNWKLVKGSVEEYQFAVNVEITPQSAGDYGFQGDVIWLNLDSYVWNNAAQNQQAALTIPPGGTDRVVVPSVYEFPLYAVSTNCNWSGSNDGNNNGVNLCPSGSSTGGVPLSFYGTPSTSGVCATLAGLTQSNCAGAVPGGGSNGLNASLSGNAAPDSRMQQLVYFPVTVQRMQNDCNVLGCYHNPTVQITVLLYTLRIGEYILTNPDRTALGVQVPGCTGLGCTIDGINAWLANPLNDALLLMIAFVVVVIIFLPEITTLLMVLMGQRRGVK